MKYPIGRESFDQVRQEGYLYVDVLDKTWEGFVAEGEERYEKPLLDVVDRMMWRDYWFATVTPSYLIRLLSHRLASGYLGRHALLVRDPHHSGVEDSTVVVP